MLTVGCLLGNVDVINIAKDIDHEWSRALRLVYAFLTQICCLFSNSFCVMIDNICMIPTTEHTTHERTHARTPARTHACTHARTHARTHAHTHTHTHTHTRAKRSSRDNHCNGHNVFPQLNGHYWAVVAVPWSSK